METIEQYGATAAQPSGQTRVSGGDSFTLSPCHPVTVSSVAVRCRGVTKEFGTGDSRTRALQGADLDVYTGEMTLLVGPSGCGKTTLISIVAALLDASDGEVRVLGKDLARLSGRQKVLFRGSEIGFVFQQYNLLPSLTAAENAAVPLLIQGQPRGQAVSRATELLTDLGLGNRVTALPSQLSGGQQQRVAIARALIHEPRLIVTHDSRVFRFGDRIISMSDGRVEKVEVRGQNTAFQEMGVHHAS
jgi:putative ABC transport system ATP-binding protein